jgi:hypothetical protein
VLKKGDNISSSLGVGVGCMYGLLIGCVLVGYLLRERERKREAFRLISFSFVRFKGF